MAGAGGSEWREGCPEQDKLILQQEGRGRGYTVQRMMHIEDDEYRAMTHRCKDEVVFKMFSVK